MQAKFLFIFIFGFLGTMKGVHAQDMGGPQPVVAEANLESKNGSGVSGSVEFTQTPSGLNVNYIINGLKKGQVHGFHIHEKGDCSASDGSSAGGHYIELALTGGTSLDTPKKYAGDMHEIKADAAGMAQGNFTINALSVDKTNPVIGRAVIVHAGPDNILSKASKRIACGVIKIKLPSL